MNPDYNKIFIQSSCLTHNEMIEYLSGNLSADDKRRIEIHLADCDMCNDELEGLSNMNNVNDLPLIVTSVNSEIDSIIEKEKFKIVAAGSKKINFKRIFSVAASVALLITIGFVINNFADKNSDNLAQVESVPESLKEEAEISEEFNTTTEAKSIKEEMKQENISVKVVEPDENQSVLVDDLTLPETTDSDIDISFETYDTDEVVVSDDFEAGEVTPIVENEYTGSRNNKIQKTDTESTGVTTDKSTEKADKNFLGYTSRNISMKKSPSAEVNYLSIRNSGLLSYNIKSYKEAAVDFKNYLNYKPEDYEIVYKLGMSYYFQKKYNSAISGYNKIISGDINKYVEDAQWYKSKSLIYQGKEDEALSILNQIVFKNGKYQKRALDAINQLENK